MFGNGFFGSGYFGGGYFGDGAAVLDSDSPGSGYFGNGFFGGGYFGGGYFGDGEALAGLSGLLCPDVIAGDRFVPTVTTHERLIPLATFALTASPTVSFISEC